MARLTRQERYSRSYELQELLKRAGVTQVAFAKRLSVPAGRVMSWKGGYSNPPDWALEAARQLVREQLAKELL